eukprot:12884119-Alexandrium_andersonii.AAC.1
MLRRAICNQVVPVGQACRANKKVCGDVWIAMNACKCQPRTSGSQRILIVDAHVELGKGLQMVLSCMRAWLDVCARVRVN